MSIFLFVTLQTSRKIQNANAYLMHFGVHTFLNLLSYLHEAGE